MLIAPPGLPIAARKPGRGRTLLATYDAFLFWYGTGILVSAIVSALPLGLLAVLYGPPLDRNAIAWDQYVLTWAASPALMAWLYLSWSAWKGMPCGFWALAKTCSVGRAALLGLAAFAAQLAIGFGMASLFPGSFVQDAAVFIAIMKSPLAAMMFVTLVVTGPPLEEIVFRGVLQTSLMRAGYGYWSTAAITSLLWSLPHGYSLAGGTAVFLMGLPLAALRWRTGSIIPCIAAHAAYNLIDGMMLMTATT